MRMALADVAALAPPAHVLFSPTGTAAGTSTGAVAWKSIVLRPGDTIWQLAVTYRTTPQALVAKNHLPAGGSLVHPGQRIVVPVRVAPKPKAAPSRIHVVRAGETMTGIAERYHVTLAKLLAANALKNPGVIHVGQHIRVPGAAPRSSTAPRSGANTFAGYTYSDATVAAARANRARLAAASVPSRQQTATMIRRTAIRHGVDPRLALAVAWQESGWNQRAVSVANAIGTMQVMPSSGRWASELAGRRLDLLDTQDNITAGVLILRALRSSADTREQAIAGYYQGLRSVRTRGLFADTKTYVAAVLAHYKRL
jgi:LysM repeat protein